MATKINDVWQLMVYDAFGKLIAEYGVPAEGAGGVRYIQQDWQGSVRAVANSNGHVVARTDHQAFGEEIGVGVGLRKIEQGYSADKATRQGYGLTENDESSGQQHTWFRKLETQAGRWTSPDPYIGSMSVGNPQSFNRYSYVENDPVNFVDPSGLCSIVTTINANGQITSTATSGCTVTINGGGQSPVSGGGGIFGDGVFLPEEGPGEGIDIGGGGQPSPADDCIPGIPCVKGLLKEALENRKKRDECVKTADQKARNALRDLITEASRLFPLTDGELATQAAARAGIGGAAGASTARRRRRGKNAAIGAAAGAATVYAERIIARFSWQYPREMEIFKTWRDDLKKCGITNPVPGANYIGV